MNTKTKEVVAFERDDAEMLLALNSLAEAMKKDYDSNGFAGNYSTTFHFGSKYIKVLFTSRESSSVAGFIVNSDNAKFPYGSMLKVASRNAPALNFSRGNIFNPTDREVRWTGIL